MQSCVPNCASNTLDRVNSQLYITYKLRNVVSLIHHDTFVGELHKLSSPGRRIHDLEVRLSCNKLKDELILFNCRTIPFLQVHSSCGLLQSMADLAVHIISNLVW